MNQRPILRKDNIENAVMKICKIIGSERKNESSWIDYTEEQLWFELVSCILGSRVLFETAKACAQHLINSDLLDISVIINKPRDLERKLKKELNKPIYPPYEGKKGCKYRFPNSRSQHIIKTAIEIYRNSKTTIKDILRENRNAFETRNILIKKCHGIGPKQASLFLRNVLYCDNLAIIDSHVVRYIDLLKLREKALYHSEQKNYYLYNESILFSYAKSKRKSLGTLDLAIWVVMSVAQKEFLI